jgi:hypothetical protein
MIVFEGASIQGALAPSDELPKEGDVLLVFCRGCRRNFTWVCPGDTSLPPSFHSKNCRRSKYARFTRNGPKPCPTPQKKKYPTPGGAEEAFRGHTKNKGFGAQPYRCRCGAYHLGNVNYVVLEKVNMNVS